MGFLRGSPPRDRAEVRGQLRRGDQGREGCCGRQEEEAEGSRPPRLEGPQDPLRADPEAGQFHGAGPARGCQRGDEPIDQFALPLRRDSVVWKESPVAVLHFHVSYTRNPKIVRTMSVSLAVSSLGVE